MEDLKLDNELKEEIKDLELDEIFDLATDYENEEEYIKANKLYQYLIEKGDVKAKNNLGWNYLEARGVKKNINKAIELLKPLAKQGIELSMVNLGYCYEDLEQYEEAYKWHERAALKGDPRGMFAVAVCTLYGLGVNVNYDIAYNYFIKLETEYAENHPDIFFCMGKIYCSDGFSKKDVYKGVEYYNKAIECGYAGAYCELGREYMDENSKVWDEMKGFECFEKGAQLDDAVSCSNLAKAYELGVGTDKNYKMAIKYYQKAIELGHLKSKEDLENLLNNMEMSKDI